MAECIHGSVAYLCIKCQPSDYNRGKADGIKEGMERAVLIAEGHAKHCISGCCEWTAKEIRSAKEKL